jgi:Cu-Zn family superoxide dismutase
MVWAGGRAGHCGREPESKDLIVRELPLVIVALLATLLLTACAGQSTDTASQGTEGQGAVGDDGANQDEATADPTGEASAADDGDATLVTLQSADGAEMGTVELSQETDGLHVRATVDGLDSGEFHGFHVHGTASCDPDDPEGPFMSAGGHYDPDDADHAAHAGDMPPLLARQDGSTTLELVTDRIDLDELRGETAIIVHADRDNQGNIPDRYTAEDADAPGPDEDTLATGDAGARLACGLIE